MVVFIWTTIKSLPLPWIVGISVGIFVLLLIILRIIVFYLRRRYARKESFIGEKPIPVPPPLDRSHKEKLSDGRILTTYPPRVIIGSPERENKVQKVMFGTEASGDVFIPSSGGQPKALRFIRPHEVIIREGELPKEVPMGDGRLVVKKFTPKGFLIEEISTYNVQVEVEVYL